MSKQVYLFSTSSHPQTISINSLDITLFKPSIDFFKYDYFILTSKQAVESLKQYEPSSYKPALCISKQTAQAYKDIGGSVLEIGLGYGDSLEKLVKQYSKEINWLYLRAFVVASDFVEVLEENNYSVDSVIVYESRCSKEIDECEVAQDSTLIFTSPSSVNCFLKNHEIDTLSKVIVIGKTTAKALPKNINYLISKEKTISSCMELV